MQTRIVTRLLHTAAFAFVCVTTAAAQQGGFPWRTDLSAAQAEAAQTNRLVLVHFWSTSCVPCMKMEREIFPQPGLAEAITANYVPVKVNTDENRELAAQYGVQFLPSDVVLSPSGDVVTQMVSPQSAEKYLAALSAAADGHRSSAGGQVAAAAVGGAVLGAGAAQQYGAPSHAMSQQPAAPGAPAAAQPGYGAPQEQSRANSNAPAYAAAGAAAGYGAAQAATNESQSLVGDRYQHRMNNQQAQPATPQVEQPSHAGHAYPSTAPTAAAPSSTPGYNPATAAVGDRYASRYNNSYEPNQPPATPVQPQTQPYYPQPGGAGGNQPQQPQAGYYPTTPEAAQQMAPAGQYQQQYQPAPNYVAQQPPVAAQQQQQQPAHGPEQHPGQPGVPAGLDGFCPVKLVENRSWVPGNPNFVAQFHGQTYYLSGPAERERFQNAPDLYSPVAGGYDPVIAVDQGRNVAGLREYGVYYGNQVYLFATQETRNEFERNPNRYAGILLQARR